MVSWTEPVFNLPWTARPWTLPRRRQDITLEAEDDNLRDISIAKALSEIMIRQQKRLLQSSIS